MNRCLVWCFACAAVVSSVYASPPCCEIIADAATGRVLYSNNSTTKTQPASLTKMMTLYITFLEIMKGNISLDDRVPFSKLAVSQKPSKLGVQCGASISVREAIVALVVKSANDVAFALAERISGSVPEFVKLMNYYAKILGMHDTNFSNPSGWKCKTQYTTATDMVKLSRALLRNLKGFYSVFSVKEVKYCGSVIKNHNNVLGTLPGGIIVDGIKTGYVAASGFNLVASARKGEQRLIVVVLGGPTGRWRDRRVKRLIECGFNNMLPKPLIHGNLMNCKISRPMRKHKKLDIEKLLGNDVWNKQSYRH